MEVVTAAADPTSTERMAKPRARLEFLDALRGLAAVYVILYHMVLLPTPHLALPPWFAALAGNGGSGVTLFFVVSTFSLFYTMPARLREPSPRFSFYLHRFFRIAPLFYVVLLLTLWRDHAVFGVDHSLSETAGMMTFVYNLVPGRQESFVWAGWTIGVEMLFYAIFPLVYKRVNSVYGAVAFFVIALLVWHVFNYVLDYLPVENAMRESVRQWFVLRHLPIFAFGGICYFLLKDRILDGRRGAHGASVGLMLVLAAIYLYMALLSGWLPNVFGAQYYWQGVVYSLAMCGLCFWPWALLVNRLTVFLGKVSYSLYLLHPTVVYFMAPYYAKIYAGVPTATAALLVCFAVTLLIVSGLSFVTYKLVEEPFVKAGRRIYTYASRRGVSSGAGAGLTHRS
ncbi:peptidoglycan/LPS O-acetylase OafA/YrhL [Luteibacter sp. W1I16]|uniref:acyltransferase family protein n=1 Tax=Luteibacter sp. W1I16 TaxID=3373922 RepID=UPI003D22F1B5